MTQTLKGLRITNIRRGEGDSADVIYARLECSEGILYSGILDWIVKRVEDIAWAEKREMDNGD